MLSALPRILLKTLLSKYRGLCGMPTFILLQLVTVLHILQGNPIPLQAAHLVHDDSIDHLVGRQVHLEVHHVPLLFRDLPQGLLEMSVACTEDIISGVIF